jgi:hypothetical protein
VIFLRIRADDVVQPTPLGEAFADAEEEASALIR